MEKINAAITGVQGYVPDYVLTNKELETLVDTNDEWIVSRTGVKERRILKEEGKGSSELGTQAIKGLLAKTNTSADEIDLIICATATPDMVFPSTACIIANNVGAKNAFAYDLMAACSGFLFALSTASKFIETGTYKKVIVVGADKMSSIVDYTERATCIIFGDGAGAVLLEPTKDGLGIQDSILKSDGSEAKSGEMGDIVVKLPLPPGTFPTLWNADKRYKENYMDTYPGFYQTYDAGHIDEDGYVWIMSRTDDVINVAGHRLSTGAIEEVLSDNKDVAECAVVGIADNLKGQLPIGLVVLKTGISKKHEDVSKECIQMVRDKIGPVAAFKTTLVIKRLPKTRSGKILRGTIRKIADKASYTAPATIDDPKILEEIKDSLKLAGII